MCSSDLTRILLAASAPPSQLGLELPDLVSRLNQAACFQTPNGEDLADREALLQAALGRRELAFLCLREARRPDSLAAGLRKCFGGPLILNEGLNLDSARQALQSGECDAVAFGRLFIANPDLVERIAARAPLKEYSRPLLALLT